MKRLSIVTVVTLFALSLAAKTSAGVAVVAFKVEGVVEEKIGQKVVNTIKPAQGVLDAAIDWRSMTLVAAYNDELIGIENIAETLDLSGYDLAPVDRMNPPGQGDTRAELLKSCGEFYTVMRQTRQGVEKYRYELVRNLAEAMKLRRDAILKLANGEARKVQQPGEAGCGDIAALAAKLGEAVDKFAAVSDKKDAPQVYPVYYQVRIAFWNLAKCIGFESYLSASSPGIPPIVQELTTKLAIKKGNATGQESPQVDGKRPLK